MHQGCIEVPVEDKSVNMVAFSQNQEVSADQLIIDRRCDIFADELTIWKVLEVHLLKKSVILSLSLPS